MDKIAEITGALKKLYPDAKVALDFDGPFQLMVAVVLSAQCTDVRVNMVTPALFKKFPGPREMAECDILELEDLIHSTGFYRNKAKNIRAAAEMLVADFGGEMPSTMEELIRLPGVARKSANVILSGYFGVNEGVVVDTHVCRLTGLLGLVPDKLAKQKNAVKIEQILMKEVPQKDWGVFSMMLVFHGRNVCIARRPQCEKCPLNKICPSSTV